MQTSEQNWCRDIRDSCTRWCQQVLGNLPLAVGVVDSGGRIVFFNAAAAALGGPTLREGTHLSEFAAQFRVRRPDGTPCGWKDLPPYRSIQFGEVNWGEELVGTAPLGEELPTMVFAAPIRGAEGEIVGAVALLQDLRPTKLAQRARDEFAAMISHDLKNLLSAAIVASELLMREQTGPLNETQRRAVQLVDSSSHKMRELLSRSLDLSKMEIGRFEVEAVPTDLGEVVREAVEAIAERTKGVNVQLEVKLQPVPEVWLDRERIAQVLLNLLDNALKFSPPGGTVEVVTDLGYWEARVSVLDEGPGIAAEELPYVFDRFYQARKPRKMGTGLGLAICRAIIEAHGGLIWAEPRPGGGSIFTFSLPLPPPV